MHVQLGTTLDGHPAHLDTSKPSLTVFLADPGHGKTTLARFLTRWWLVRADTTVTVHSRRPHEWADLSEAPKLTLLDIEEGTSSWAPEPTTSLARHHSAARPTHLTVLDGVDAPGLGRIPALPHPGDMVIATATGDWFGADLAEATRHQGALHRWGLLLPTPRKPDNGPLQPELHGCSADPLQSRLDWGAQTQPLWPHRRGPRDFPCHRWTSCPIVHTEPSAATSPGMQEGATTVRPRSHRR